MLLNPKLKKLINHYSKSKLYVATKRVVYHHQKIYNDITKMNNHLINDLIDIIIDEDVDKKSTNTVSIELEDELG